VPTFEIEQDAKERRFLSNLKLSQPATLSGRQDSMRAAVATIVHAYSK
jgi:hypothetical protein